jgi:hypothetical protein
MTKTQSIETTSGWPTTVADAVARLRKEMDEETLVLLRGTDSLHLVGFHYSLGLTIRSVFGLWKGNVKLQHDCDVDHPDEASAVILNALWEDLISTATPEQLERARKARVAYDGCNGNVLRHHAEHDALLTDRTCPECSKPCPRYRETCKHCNSFVGREV